MTQLRILRGFCLGGGVDVYPGQEISGDKIPAGQLKSYLQSGKVEEIIPEDHTHEENDAASVVKNNKGGRKR